MPPLAPRQRALADELLTSERVAAFIASYKGTAPVVWSGSRVLYRMKIAGRREAPGSLKRRARRVLEELAAAGLLAPKRAPAQNPDGSREPAFVLVRGNGAPIAKPRSDFAAAPAERGARL